MKILFFLLAAFLAVNAATYEDISLQEWKLYKAQFNKPDEGPMKNLRRMDIFLENKKKIAEHNLKYAKGEVTYEMGLNEFSDRFPEELAHLNGFRYNHTAASKLKVFDTIDHEPPPESINWVEKGAVTPVKNQGKCGSCYAFSAMGSLESMYYIKHQQQVRLSEQNIVDCTEDYGNLGCNGGDTAYSLVYVKKNKGVDTEASYPYEAKQGSCRFKKDNVGAKVSEVFKVEETEKALVIISAVFGPLSVAVHATKNFQNYKGGIFYDSTCKNTTESLNHAVLLVGYGTENGTPYWLVKNSWGTKWGENGYIKMARNKNNNCGIATYAVFPYISDKNF